jgi:hypothetical protein
LNACSRVVNGTPSRMAAWRLRVPGAA